MLIGIGGCSRSGKSTLAEDLTWHYRCHNLRTIVLRQDDFVIRTDDIPVIKGQSDWDNPLSIDFELVIETYKFLKNRFDIIIIDGLFAFYNNDLNRLYDKRILVEISEATFRTRRQAETRWGREPDWFIDHVWESYLKFGIYDNRLQIGNSGGSIVIPDQQNDHLKISGEVPFELYKIIAYLSEV